MSSIDGGNGKMVIERIKRAYRCFLRPSSFVEINGPRFVAIVGGDLEMTSKTTGTVTFRERPRFYSAYGRIDLTQAYDAGEVEEREANYPHSRSFYCKPEFQQAKA